MAQDVLYSSKGTTATITLNRPEKRNIMTESLLRGLEDSIERANNDPTIRAIILTGNGHSFCAGADLSQKIIKTPTPEMTHDFIFKRFGPAVKAIVNSPKPVIAAVTGYAAGGGMSLALACDFLVMSEEAAFVQAFMSIALVPDGGASYLLVRKIGYQKALEFAIEGKPIPAKKCQELGLAWKVVPSTELMKTCEQWADFIAQRPSFSVQLSKSALKFAEDASSDDVIKYEAKIQQYCVESQDHHEGIKAFFEKRKPKFVHDRPRVPQGILSKL